MPPTLPPVWRDYRARRRLFVAVVAALVPVLAWTARLESVAGGHPAARLLALGWLAAFVGATAWLASFRCPFCGEPFDWTVWVANPFSEACLHCGFRRWRDPHAARILSRRRG